MDFPFPFIDIFTIPTDAGPGDARVVINGPAGRIEIYDTNGDIVGVLDDAHGFQVNEPGNTETGALVAMRVIGGQPQIFMATDDITIGAAAFTTDISDAGTGDERAFLRIAGPTLDGGQPVFYLYTPEDSAGPGGGGVALFSTDDLRISPSGFGEGAEDGYSLGRGLITGKSFVSTGNNGPHAVDTVTDFAISNIPVIGGRTYEVWLKSGWDIDAAGIWSIDLNVNGTKIDEFDQIQVTTGLNGKTCKSCLWTPSVSAITDDLTVTANELSGASQITFTGGADQPRRMYLKDIGVL